MTLIDDKGRIFGTINIIDALTLLLVFAVVAASAAFVLATGDRPTNHATTDQPGNAKLRLDH